MLRLAASTCAQAPRRLPAGPVLLAMRELCCDCAACCAASLWGMPWRCGGPRATIARQVLHLVEDRRAVEQRRGGLPVRLEAHVEQRGRQQLLRLLDELVRLLGLGARARRRRAHRCVALSLAACCVVLTPRAKKSCTSGGGGRTSSCGREAGRTWRGTASPQRATHTPHTQQHASSCLACTEKWSERGESGAISGGGAGLLALQVLAPLGPELVHLGAHHVGAVPGSIVHTPSSQTRRLLSVRVGPTPRCGNGACALSAAPSPQGRKASRRSARWRHSSPCIRVLLVVALVVGLGLVERGRRHHLGDDGARPHLRQFSAAR